MSQQLTISSLFSALAMVLLALFTRAGNGDEATVAGTALTQIEAVQNASTKPGA